MKKIMIAFYVGIAVLFCACSVSSMDKSEAKILEANAFQFKATDDTASLSEDIDLNMITKNPENEILAITVDGVVYSHIEDVEAGIDPCTFYLYLFETQETIELGSIYNCSYGFGETFVDHKLYIPRICRLTPEGEDSGWIIELDLDSKEMSVISTAKNHDSFYSRNMQGFGKHLILQQTEEDFQQIIAYDTETKEMIGLKKYQHNNEGNTGEWISAFDVGVDTVSILVKAIDITGEEDYRIEVYDREIKLVDTIDVTGILDWSHGVYDFEYEDGYLICSNINNSGIIAEIMNSEIEVIASFEDISFYLMSEATECMQYKLWIDQQEKLLYRFDMLQGVLEKTVLYSGYSDDIFISAKRYSEEIIVVNEVLLDQSGEEEDQYILINELDFTKVE